MPWIQLKLNTTGANAEELSDALMEAGSVSITFQDTHDTPVFEPLPGETRLWGDTDVIGLFDAETDMKEVVAILEQHPLLGEGFVHKIEQLEDKDWEREWMKNYHPIECANGLWIVPKWMTPPEPTATNIMMDPGLAFGTGYHATTRLCLDWLTEQDLAGKTVIDYGCGSGILGIAALLLGAKQVYAVDIDPQAVLATKQNAERNQVLPQLAAFLPDEFNQFCQDNDILPVDFVTANILAKPLMGLAPYFATLLPTEGSIVLAGLIENQVDDVKAAYTPYFVMSDDFTFSSQEDKHWHRLAGKRRVV
mgnify:CR=1 FL=1